MERLTHPALLEKMDSKEIRAIILACRKLKEQFPNNKGKIYISNILGYFVNAKNKEDIIGAIGYIPSFNQDKVAAIFDFLATERLATKFEGGRSAIYIKINEYFITMLENELAQKKNAKPIVISDEIIIHIGYAMKKINELYPANKGKVYISNVGGYFINEKHHTELRRDLGVVPTYPNDVIEATIDEMIKRKMAKKVVGNKGATIAYLFINRYDEFVADLTKPAREYTKEDNYKVIYACQQLVIDFPKNKGKVYVSNICGYFVNKANADKLIKEFGKVPTYTKFDIDHIVNNLVGLKLLYKTVGDRGATFVKLNAAACEKYCQKGRIEFTDNNYNAVVFAVRQLREKYPANKGKVYVSNLSAYFKFEENQKALMDNLGYAPVFVKDELELIVVHLSEKKILYRHEGNRGATYVTLDDKKYEEIFHKRDFTDDDYNAVVFAVRQLREKYPANKGKVYVSNLHAYFRITENNKILIENFGYVPVFSKYELEMIVIKLSEQRILYRHEGNRGATYVTLDDKKYDEIFHKRDFTEDDYNAIVFAVRQLRDKYPKNKGKVYVSNLHAYFKIDANHQTIMDNLGYHPVFSKYELESIVKDLAAKKVLYRHEGERGATYVMLDEKKYAEIFGRKTFTIEDYKAIVFAVRHLRKKYPKNKGKVYVSNIHAFFKIDANHDLIMENLGCHPTFTKYELEGIVKDLAAKKILYRHEGERGATYVTLDDKKFDELIGISKEDKETLILKILMIMNGRAYLDTIYDIIFNDEFSRISVEMNTIFKDKYFQKRKGFKTVEDVDETLISLHDQGLIFIYGHYIKLSTEAVLKFPNL